MKNISDKITLFLFILSGIITFIMLIILGFDIKKTIAILITMLIAFVIGWLYRKAFPKTLKERLFNKDYNDDNDNDFSEYKEENELSDIKKEEVKTEFVEENEDDFWK